MARPSRNTDLQLIEAGRRLLPKAGVSGLSLRQVADEANVNLGMFHYHFKSKDEFAQHVLQVVYEEFFSALEAESRRHTESPERDPLERLRGLLKLVGHFAFSNRELLASIMKDLLSGEKVVAAFMAANAPRHIGLLIRAIEDCQKQGLLRQDLAAVQAVVMAASSIAAPSVIATAVERAQPDLIKGSAKKVVFTPDVIELRVETFLRGMMP